MHNIFRNNVLFFLCLCLHKLQKCFVFDLWRTARYFFCFQSSYSVFLKCPPPVLDRVVCLEQYFRYFGDGFLIFQQVTYCKYLYFFIWIAFFFLCTHSFPNCFCHDLPQKYSKYKCIYIYFLQIFSNVAISGIAYNCVKICSGVKWCRYATRSIVISIWIRAVFM